MGAKGSGEAILSSVAALRWEKRAKSGFLIPFCSAKDGFKHALSFAGTFPFSGGSVISAEERYPKVVQFFWHSFKVNQPCRLGYLSIFLFSAWFHKNRPNTEVQAYVRSRCLCQKLPCQENSNILSVADEGTFSVPPQAFFLRLQRSYWCTIYQSGGSDTLTSWF